MSTQILEQMVMEATYSKTNIRSKVYQAITEEMPQLKGPIVTAMGMIHEYLDTPYTYVSKSERVNRLRSIVEHDSTYVQDLVMEILILVLPKEGEQTIQAVTGQLAGALGYEHIIDGIKTAAELVALGCMADLYDIIPAKDSTTGSMMIENKHRMPESIHQYIANTKYLPPMVCPPLILKENSDSAYLTKHDSVILGKGNHHEYNQALDALNIANQISLSLDHDVLAEEEQPADKIKDEIKGKSRNGITPLEQFRRMANASRKVYKELLEAGNVFYFTHKYDKRGRMYTQGYHVNLQSTEYKRALINLSTQHIITGE